MSEVVGTVRTLDLGEACQVKDNGKGNLTLYGPGGPIVSRSKWFQALLRESMSPVAREPEPDKGPVPGAVSLVPVPVPVPARARGLLDDIGDAIEEFLP